MLNHISKWFFVVVISVLLLCGCGKKGPPVAPSPAEATVSCKMHLTAENPEPRTQSREPRTQKGIHLCRN